MLTTMRFKCKTCNGHYLIQELLAGICAHCLQLRAESYAPGKYEIPNFTDGQVYRCFECSTPIPKYGYLHWFNDAKVFGFLCVRCSDKKIMSDAQYRDTPFAFQHKAQ